MRVLFRFDASPEIGLGHQSRCLALAACLHHGTGAEVTAMGRTVGSLPSWLDHRVPSSDPEEPGEPGEPGEFLQVAAEVNADLIVIDRYGTSQPWLKAVKASGRRTLRLLDSPVDLPMCDYVLDQSPAHSEDDYVTARTHGCELMIGARWALIGPAFFTARYLPPPSNGDRPRVLLVMGGSDPSDAALDVLRAVCQFATPLSIIVVAGNPLQRTKLELLTVDSHHEVAVVPPTDDMAGLSYRSDVAIGAGGVSALERCVVGLPSVLVPTAENQRPNVSALVSAGAAVESERTAASLIPALQQVLDDLEAMSRAAKSVCDGLGALRCARVLGAVPSVNLRPATERDKALVYGHQMCPPVRQWFRTIQAPSWQEHCAWYDSTMADPRVDLRLIESAGFTLGQLRTDLRDDGRREVSILVVPEAQGMGVATSALRAALAEHGNSLVADIHPENGASIAAFVRAGFTRVGERDYEVGGKA